MTVERLSHVRDLDLLIVVMDDLVAAIAAERDRTSTDAASDAWLEAEFSVRNAREMILRAKKASAT